MSSSQARCVQTAILSLVEHDALSAGTTFKDRQDTLEAADAYNSASAAGGGDDVDKIEDHRTRPKRSAELNADGITLLSCLREIHVSGGWEDHASQKGRKILSRVLRLLKEQDFVRINQEVCKRF